MARIIGGIAASHTPTIGFAFDRDKQHDPVWQPIFAAFAPLQQWIAERRPDVLLFIYNDHVTSFFFDHYSAFSLGIGERWAVADEGAGARDLPPVDGHPALAAHIGRSLMADEFDLSFFQQRALDHGCFSPLSVMCPPEETHGRSEVSSSPSGGGGGLPTPGGARQETHGRSEVSSSPSGGGGGLPTPGGAHEPQWPVRLVPLQVGVLQFPIPSARRCWKLGQALRRAIESYPEDLRVAVVATGGLSHQVHGERAGFNNPEWDARFLDLLERDPEQLAEMTQAQYATLGGFEGAEVIMWLVMRGALAGQVQCRHRSYTLPSMTGIATAIYEPAEQAPAPGAAERQRAHVAAQLDGIEALPGTHPFTLERSVRGYRINRFLHDLIDPAHRSRFLADEEAALRAADLTDTERDLIRRRDWRGMIHYGVIFFMLEKLGAVVGVSNLHIYAAMRGEPLADFLATRNAPGALYSVAGRDAKALSWATPPAGH